jgi:CheY-like chemotaxis protein
MKQPVKVLLVEDVEDAEDDAKQVLRALRHGRFEATRKRVQTAAELETVPVEERWDAVIKDFMMPGFTRVEALGIFRLTWSGHSVAQGGGKGGRNRGEIAPASAAELR